MHSKPTKPKRDTRKVLVLRLGILAINVLFFTGIAILINASVGKHQSASMISNNAKLAISRPIDALSSSNIAVNLARMSSQDTSDVIAQQAELDKSLLLDSNGAGLGQQKPLVIDTELKSHNDIIRYKTGENETIADLAQRFGVTSDSIRWSNDLGYSNILPAGKILLIPPVNGIVYKVKKGDTPESLARKFNANAKEIIAFNDAEVGGLRVGQMALIPNGRIIATAIASYYSYGGRGICGQRDTPSIKRVNRGDTLGMMGTTGTSYSIHLHFAMCDSAGGSYIDPAAGHCQDKWQTNSSDCDIKFGFGWPVADRGGSTYVSRGFTPGYHRGIDIGHGGITTPIQAVEAGDIISCGYAPGGGETIVILHDNGIVTTYMHMITGSLRC